MVQQVHSYFSVKGESIPALVSHRSQRPLAFEGFPNIVVVSYRLLTASGSGVHILDTLAWSSLFFTIISGHKDEDPLNRVYSAD